MLLLYDKQIFFRYVICPFSEMKCSPVCVVKAFWQEQILGVGTTSDRAGKWFATHQLICRASTSFALLVHPYKNAYYVRLFLSMVLVAQNVQSGAQGIRSRMSSRWIEVSHFGHVAWSFCGAPWQKENLCGHLGRQLSAKLTTALPSLSCLSCLGSAPQR